MSATCLHISQLTCAYTRGKPVMEVPDLRVQRGELMFLLGRSGIGKSTFLELAGMMNLPAGSVEGEVFFNDPAKGSIAVLDLWNGPNQLVSTFRSGEYDLAGNGSRTRRGGGT
jgi:ABC-type glutathione transport system ATPase component